MTTTIYPDTRPAGPGNTDDDDELNHAYCDCDPDTALCGRDITDAPEGDTDDPVCIVCHDMIERPCERCGDEW